MRARGWFLTGIFFFQAWSGPTFASSAKPTKGALRGTWELVSFVMLDKAGKETLWCKGVHGLLGYNSAGYMSAAINCAADTPPTSPSKHYANQLLYAGTYDLSSQGDVHHHISNASLPSFIGKTVVRHVEELTEDRLVLSGDFGGPFRIVWKRAISH